MVDLLQIRIRGIWIWILFGIYLLDIYTSRESGQKETNLGSAWPRPVSVNGKIENAQNSIEHANIDTTGVLTPHNSLYSYMYRQDKPNRQINRQTDKDGQIGLCNMHQRKKKQKPVMYGPTSTDKSNRNGYILFIIPLSHSLKYPFRMRMRMRKNKTPTHLSKHFQRGGRRYYRHKSCRLSRLHPPLLLGRSSTGTARNPPKPLPTNALFRESPPQARLRWAPW